MKATNPRVRQSFIGYSQVMAVLANGYAAVCEAERAYVLRDASRLDHIAQALRALPDRSISAYYEGLSFLQRGLTNQSSSVLGTVSESGPRIYRARAHLTLGTIDAGKADFEAARAHYGAAQSLSIGCDLRSYIISRQNFAALEGMDGDHRRSLSHLEDLGRLVQIGQRDYPFLGVNYLNSLAVELDENGRIGEAIAIARQVSRWPLLDRYAAIKETCDTLAEKTVNRSQITLHQPEVLVHNIHQMSAATPQPVEQSQSEPGKLLAFQRPAQNAERGYPLVITFGQQTPLFEGEITEKQMQKLLRFLNRF